MNRDAMLKRFRSWSLHKCIETTARDLQKLARMEAAGADGYAHCCSCGKRHHWKKMDGGHFVSRKHKATILDRQNVHAQCKRCNMSAGNLPGYHLFLQSTYGKTTPEKLMAIGREVKQWTREELVDIRLGLRQEIKQHEKRLGE